MRTFVFCLLILSAPLSAQVPKPMPVTKDITLEKDAVLRESLDIRADNITIDGNGATLLGMGKPGDTKSLGAAGIGIRAEGRSSITIRNIKVHGYESGLVATDGEGWVIENCDFSGNYHDPDHGWGDGKRNGGIILTRICKSVIRNNKANNVWNGLDLWECDDNTIEKNDFSHCSNVCLKMWTACRNVVTDNNLSYGLRIRPGEVHARDSTSVLMESGSNDNRFERNDITHGGDGVFIRVLNGWVSTGNVFIENDCSYANNNGFEAWSPGNTYIGNKANHCSYGFWLGGSDQTILRGNEAAYNGQPDGFHNAPESDFTHGGIVIVHGPGSHSIIEGNYCHHNNGGGIVFRGDLGTRGAKWKMFHLIVQNNRLEHNRCGIFGRFTDWLDLAGNTFKDNESDECFEEVDNLTRREPDPEGHPAPEAVLEGPSRARTGIPVVFDASKSTDVAGRPLSYQWYIGGTIYTTPKVERVFVGPGFHRIGLTVTNGYLADLAFVDFYVTRPVKEVATEGQASVWGWEMGDNADGKGNVRFTNDAVAIMGKTSVHMRPDPYKGADVSAIFPKTRDARWQLSGGKQLSFWMRFQNGNHGFQGPNPIVRLHSGKRAFTYVPALNNMPRNLLGDPPYSEARWGWLHVTVPLGGSSEWVRSETFAGARPPHLDNGLEFTTVSTPIQTQGPSSLASDGKDLYCATMDGERFLRSADGRGWTGLKKVSADLRHRGSAWINGMLAYYARGGDKGQLVLRCRAEEKNAFGQDVDRLVAYDIAADTWSWVPTTTILGHGATVVGDHVYGIAHAIMGNYGGPICRVNLASPGAGDERTVLGSIKGPNDAWFSRAGQLALLNGKIYGTKNDWETPQPQEPDKIGDRLYVFDPDDFVVSTFRDGDPWDSKNWSAGLTPCKDLGPLPFEIGHGAALVPLPPNWSRNVGAQGGLFIVAGCSPSNHEGYGSPSNRYAIYDVAGAAFTTGTLPDITGTGTSAAFHDGKVYVKRGGVNFGPGNSELWIVRPLPPGEAERAAARTKTQKMSLDNIDSVSLQFDSLGYKPFSIWIDGLAFERISR
ncbi:MAG: right-handed parallel beta-helix repeat-containing protein [Phycisphaerales bacterium]|nr:MAG: right-handed parallel beta-helix repeat-containing protein [Phycisphaerales bacterium]